MAVQCAAGCWCADFVHANVLVPQLNERCVVPGIGVEVEQIAARCAIHRLVLIGLVHLVLSAAVLLVVLVLLLCVVLVDLSVLLRG